MNHIIENYFKKKIKGLTCTIQLIVQLRFYKFNKQNQSGRIRH